MVIWPMLVVGLLAVLYAGTVGVLVRVWRGDPTFSHGFLVVPLALLLAWGRLPLPVAKRGAGAPGALLGPYLFLYFAVPWPDLVVGQLSFPMQYFAAGYAGMLGGMLGLPVVRHGVELEVGRYTFAVGAPCSGMRSLVALLAVAAVLADLARGSRWRRLALFACGFPAALVANATRIALILVIGARWGEKAATGFFHEFSGVVLFALAVILLLLAARLLGLRVGELPLPGRRPPWSGWREPVRVRWPVAVLAVGLLGPAYLARAAAVPPPHFDCGALPLAVGGWQGRELPPFDRETQRMLRPDAAVCREYRQGEQPVQLVAVFGHRKETFHSPDFCLLGGGFNTAYRGRGRLPGAGTPYRWSVLTRGRGGYVVLYYFLAGEQATDSLASQQWQMVRERMAGRAAGGALIRYVAPVRGEVEETLALVVQLAGELHPHLVGCRVAWHDSCGNSG